MSSVSPMPPRPPLPRFHLAFAVDDLTAARRFYGDVLGCREGRSGDAWVDFNFHGHQIVAHLSPGDPPAARHDVDGCDIPVRHFGVILSRDQWDDLVRRLRDHRVRFLVEPTVRFAGERGEQATVFICDPAGNALEFKAFADDGQVFAA